MIAGRNIVCVASNWHDHPTSKHHVMRRLALQNDVLWINFHASRRPRLTRSDSGAIVRRLRQVLRGPQRVAPGIDNLSPLLVPLPDAGWARWVNGVALARQVRAALRTRPARPTQLWLFTPDVPELIPRLNLERVVYYCVDDFAAFSGFDTALIERLEADTMARSDVVLATSEQLYHDRRNRHPHVFHVPHGVDFEHFARTPMLSPADVPPPLRDLPRPVLGFMGLISDYVDLDLIAAAAQARPQWSFALVGDVRCATEPVAGRPNVHLLGGRPYDELPRICRGFDVGLIPFRMNRLVRAVNPIKLREYLAAGLPVVSASMDAVRPYMPHVHLADTLQTFLPACEAALADAARGDADARQDRVRADGWAARVAAIQRIVMTPNDVASDPPATSRAEPAATAPCPTAAR
jgi:glycosyltransferase involved in cell wall biosynthesis